MPLSDLAKLVPEGLAALKKGIRAYHGSPHDFDKFDMSKVGSGEGAQVYGHGLYFAENPATAEVYKKSIERNADALTDIARQHGLTGDAADMLAHQFSTGFGGKRFDDWIGGLRTAVDDPLLSSRVRSAAQQISDKSVEAADAFTRMKAPGKMYEVDLKVDPAHMLDWDKPLLEQTHLLGKLNAAGVTPKDLSTGTLAKYGDWGEAQARYLNDVAKKKGSEIYEEAGLRAGGYGRDAGKVATPVLYEAGIPGIKYLDQGSRITGDAERIMQKYGTREKALEIAQERLASASTGMGSSPGMRRYWDEISQQLSRPETSNFVMFNDSLIDIARKYALPGMVGSGIAGGAMQSQSVPTSY